MRFYKFRKWQQWFYPNAIFDIYQKNKCGKNIYLTFDDGPTPDVTRKLLDLLDIYNAKATFFCIGGKVKKHPELYQDIIDRGHSVGNHSMTHLNGFKTSSKKYIADILEAEKHIKSNLFRPPYGKCTPKQHKKLTELGFQTIFWSYLTYDFDNTLTPKQRFKNIKQNSKNGSIFVFHESTIVNELDKILNFLRKNNFKTKILEHC